MEFILSGFWTWLGFMFICAVIGNKIAQIILALRGIEHKEDDNA